MFQNREDIIRYLTYACMMATTGITNVDVERFCEIETSQTKIDVILNHMRANEFNDGFRLLIDLLFDFCEFHTGTPANRLDSDIVSMINSITDLVARFQTPVRHNTQTTTQNNIENTTVNTNLQPRFPTALEQSMLKRYLLTVMGQTVTEITIEDFFNYCLNGWYTIKSFMSAVDNNNLPRCLELLKTMVHDAYVFIHNVESVDIISQFIPDIEFTYRDFVAIMQESEETDDVERNPIIPTPNEIFKLKRYMWLIRYCTPNMTQEDINNFFRLPTTQFNVGTIIRHTRSTNHSECFRLLTELAINLREFIIQFITITESNEIIESISRTVQNTHEYLIERMNMETAIIQETLNSTWRELPTVSDVNNIKMYMETVGREMGVGITRDIVNQFWDQEATHTNMRPLLDKCRINDTVSALPLIEMLICDLYMFGAVHNQLFTYNEFMNQYGSVIEDSYHTLVDLIYHGHIANMVEDVEAQPRRWGEFTAPTFIPRIRDEGETGPILRYQQPFELPLGGETGPAQPIEIVTTHHIARDNGNQIDFEELRRALREVTTPRTNTNNNTVENHRVFPLRVKIDYEIGHGFTGTFETSIHDYGQAIYLNEHVPFLQDLGRGQAPLPFEKGPLVEEEDEAKACAICKCHAKSHAVTCGHQYCSDCCTSLSTNKKCAVCRSPVFHIIKLF